MILILNGTSSSGKSSLVRALQNAMPSPYLDAGVDKFLWMLPRRYLNEAPLWQQVMTPTRSGPLGLQLIMGMHDAIAALAGVGNHVVADHVLVDPRWLAHAARKFAPLQAYFIGVRCPLAVVEEREAARKDRTLGQAREQYHLIHAHGAYDFEIDTSLGTPEECALQVQAFVDQAPEPRAFRALNAAFGDK